MRPRTPVLPKHESVLAALPLVHVALEPAGVIGRLLLATTHDLRTSVALDLVKALLLVSTCASRSLCGVASAVRCADSASCWSALVCLVSVGRPLLVLRPSHPARCVSISGTFPGQNGLEIRTSAFTFFNLLYSGFMRAASHAETRRRVVYNLCAYRGVARRACPLNKALHHCPCRPPRLVLVRTGFQAANT